MVTQKEIFYQYLLNERDRLEGEVVQLRQNLRMKKDIDSIDCLELSLAMERLSAFIEKTRPEWGSVFFCFRRSRSASLPADPSNLFLDCEGSPKAKPSSRHAVNKKKFSNGLNLTVILKGCIIPQTSNRNYVTCF